jgi:hypothetical protein
MTWQTKNMPHVIYVACRILVRHRNEPTTNFEEQVPRHSNVGRTSHFRLHNLRSMAFYQHAHQEFSTRDVYVYSTPLSLYEICKACLIV